jgi:hypothetical protein
MHVFKARLQAGTHETSECFRRSRNAEEWLRRQVRLLPKDLQSAAKTDMILLELDDKAV